MHSIEIQNISKSFSGFKAVDDLSLSVPKGSIYGFIGPNGSGKTTTIRMIMNIFYPDHGEILIDGEVKSGTNLRNIGYLPEERGLYKKMKVRELLYFYGQLRRASNINQKIDHWLDKMNLREWENKKIETLSKGMSQKIQFIATILHEPEIIILDEPFSGLDPVNADIMKNIVLELKNSGKTIIFSTHDMGTAERMCDYIFMIYKGKKVLDGTLSGIQDKYGNDSIRLACDNASKVLAGISGILNVNDFGQYQELRLKEDSDPQDILKQILEVTKVSRFELTKPSLLDIFIRIASPKAEDIDNQSL